MEYLTRYFPTRSHKQSNIRPSKNPGKITPTVQEASRATSLNSSPITEPEGTEKSTDPSKSRVLISEANRDLETVWSTGNRDDASSMNYPEIRPRPSLAKGEERGWYENV